MTVFSEVIEEIKALLAQRGNFIQNNDISIPHDETIQRFIIGKELHTAEVEIIKSTPENLTIRAIIPFTTKLSDKVILDFCTNDNILQDFIGNSNFHFTKNSIGQVVIYTEHTMDIGNSNYIISHLNACLGVGKSLSFEIKGRLRQAGFSHQVHDPLTEEFWVIKTEELESKRPVSNEVIKRNKGGIDILYTRELDGGGSEFGSEMVDFVRDNIGPVKRAYEWCSGPAFMGFELLGRGLCQSLFLADINPTALDICRQTIELNKLEDKVSLCLSDCLDDIPETESWDLIVANPPFSLNGQTIPQWGNPIIYQDNDLALHERFFRDVGKFLSPGANLLILESYSCTSENDFLELLEKNDLLLKSVHASKHYRFVYHMWITRK